MTWHQINKRIVQREESDIEVECDRCHVRDPRADRLNVRLGARMRVFDLCPSCIAELAVFIGVTL